MTTTNHDDDEQEARSSSSSRRVWKRHNPSQGSSRLSLKAMTILYDAGIPLSSDDLADRLLAALDPYERSYLEAWHLRRRETQRVAQAKYAKSSVAASTELSVLPLSKAVRAWITQFQKRAYEGKTLVQDSDGRLYPGPTAPRILTLDGRLIAFTPEARRELEQAEHNAGRVHLAGLEWSRVTQKLDLSTVEARAQLLMVVVRRLVFGSNQQKAKHVLDERMLGPLLEDLVRLADTPVVQRAVVEAALDTLWPKP